MSPLFHLLPPLADAAAPAAQPGMMGTLPGILSMVLLMGGLYFLMIAPQRKKQKEHDKMVAALQTGDEVLTNGGIFGTITNVKEDRVVVRVAENAKIEVARAFVQTVLKRSGEEKK